MTTTPRKAHRKFSANHPTRPLRLWQESHHNEGETRIEMLPLMDVIFCILVFFILGAVGLSRQQAITMDLPKAKTGTPQMREILVVSLDDLGQLYVEKQPVTENQLTDAIKNYHKYNPTGLMVLHASRNASYNDVVQLLDLLRQVGGDRVALATLPGEGQQGSSIPSFGNPNSSFPTSIGGGGNPPGANPYGTTIPGIPNSPNSLPNSGMPNTGLPNNSGLPNSGLPNSGLNPTM
ncbi:MAG: ExbD/TolR family protein, partial [Microcystaceae cyanobacterium]